MLFEGFEQRAVPTPRGEVHVRLGGRGPALLLLHGYRYRMALDHPAVVSRLAVLDIVPTGEVWSQADAGFDRRLDDGDRGHRTIACPVLALWGAQGGLPGFYGDPLQPWRIYAPQVSGHAVAASHFRVEDAPEQVAADLVAFFA